MPKIGDRVYVKPSVPSAHEAWKESVVTADGKGVTVEVKGINRHIADVRRVPDRIQDFAHENIDDVANRDRYVSLEVSQPGEVDGAELTDASANSPAHRQQPARVRRPPRWMEDYLSGSASE